MRIKHLEVPQEIWEDKRIPYETKYVFGYILSKGFDRTIMDLCQVFRHIFMDKLLIPTFTFIPVSF